MFQLRTGHIPLNAYLFQFKKKENPKCPACGARKETPQHFLLECPAYAYERRKLGPKKGEMERKFAEIISSGRSIVALAHYMKATGRFAEEKLNKESRVIATRTKTHAS